MNYISVLYKGIAELVKRFQNNPFDFLYERDLQAALFTILQEAFGTERVAMKGGFWDPCEYGKSDVIRTLPVRCEYPGLHKFDVAIIDPATVRSYDENQWKVGELRNDAFWNQPVLAAVEIKYCQLGDSPRLRKAQAAADIEKLKTYLEERDKEERPFLGISLIFIMPVTIPNEFMDGAKLDIEPENGLASYVVSRSHLFKCKS